jgi:hypothetical protein
MGLAVLERVVPVLERVPVVLVAPVVQSRYCQWTSL